MGITIETAIRNLSMYDVNECGNAELHTWYKDIDKDMEESLNVAIKTMCKYQRITQIYQKFNEINFSYDRAMRKIIKVIEDENVN